MGTGRGLSSKLPTLGTGPLSGGGKPVVPPLSLSTMWAQGRFKHMAEFVAKARELGFTHVEASSSLSREMLDELMETSVPISSVHAPCPASVSSRGIPVASLSLSSTDAAERREAVRAVKRTIDIASRTGARAVIIHLGEVPVDAGLEDKLRSLFREGLVGSEVYVKAREQLIAERSSRAARYLEQAVRSLDELSEYGELAGIRLGLENRLHFREIPDINEMAALLARVEGSTVGYWHDVGHAEVQQRLGFNRHEEWLRCFGPRMIGIHLHDVTGISDHGVPGRGDVDWGMIVKYLGQDVIRTCEINQGNDEGLVREAVPFLEKMGIIGRVR